MLQTKHDVPRAGTKQLLVETAEFIAKKQQFYDADIDIYGAFSEMYSEIKKYV